ncbi:MAG: DUF2306 domain-containing protein [Rhizobiaceae bacterium]
MTKSQTPLIISAVLSVIVALVSYRFLALGLDLAFPVMQEHLLERRFWFTLHISAAPLALFVGGFQFFPKLRAKRRNLHRWMGRVYGVAVLMGGVAGLVLAFQPVNGVVSGLGFGLLAIIWVYVTAKAIWLARKGQFDEHRKWMIRSFALTFAGVTLRLYLGLFALTGMYYPEASPYLAWMCWVPNLLWANWYLRRREPAAV